MNILATPLRPLRVLPALLCLCFALPTFAANFFVTQDGDGTFDGTSLENAWSAADFNNDANWGGGAGQIKAGDIVNFSGPFTVRLTVHGSGTSESNRIIMKQAPAPAPAAVLIGFDGSNRNYIAVLGFEFTHTSGDVGAFEEVIRIADSTGWLIQDNYFHHTRGGGVSGQPNTTNTFNIIRANTFEDLTSVVQGSNGHATMQLYGHSNLIEYNTVLGSLDRTRAFGSGNVIRNNYFGPTNTLDYPLDIKVASVVFANTAARGTGYTSPPTVTFIGDVVAGGTVATASAVTLRVVSIEVTAVGSGYTSSPTVTFSGGGMTTSATATAVRDPDTNTITSVSVSAAGNFTGVPTVTFTGGGGSGAAATAIMGVGNVTIPFNSNRGYTSEPIVSFSGGGGTGATATARLDPHHVDSFQSFGNPDFPLNKLLFERNLDHDNQDPIGGTNAHGFLIQNNPLFATGLPTPGMEWAIARFNVVIRPGGVAYQLRAWKRFYGYNLTSISVHSANDNLFNSAVTFDNPAEGLENDIQDWRNNTWSNGPRTRSSVLISSGNRGTNFTSARQHTFNFGPGTAHSTLPGEGDGSVLLVANLAKEDPKFTNHAVGTLTTRTNDSTGVITLTAGTVATGQTVTITWEAQGRTGVTVGTVVGNTVPISGGTGISRLVNIANDNLPATSTVIQIWTSEDYKLASDSPLRNEGTAITTATNAGVASTSLEVADSKRLFDGWDIADGDLIKIGLLGEYVRISSIDYDTDVVTLSATRTWLLGDGVFVKGSEDVGALPFDYATEFSVRNTTPRAPPVGANNLTATVVNPDAVRMVEFIVDGIPVGIALDAPYAVTWAGADGVTEHNVEARAYNAWASQTLWQSQLNGVPNFTTHPTSQAVPLTTDVTLTVLVEGDPAPALQWKKDGVDVAEPNTSGANTASLEITNFGAANIGTYTVVATNSVGVATSSEAIVTSGDGIPLTVTGVVANNKVYDGTATTTLDTTGHALNGITDGHVVTLNAAGGVGTFVAGADAGVGKNITVSGLALSGADAALYVLVQPTGLTADITPKSLTPSVTADNKEYDGNASGGIASRSLTGIVGVDDVTLTGGTATFVSATVGTGITVNATGLTLGGAAAANYVLSSTSAATTANITQKLVTPSIAADNKEYDGSTAAVIATRSLTGVVGLDDVSLTGGTATFASAAVSNGIAVNATGLALGGTAAGNYVLSSTSAATTANITQKSVIPSATANSKEYDGNTSAVIGSRSLSGVVGLEDVTLTGGTAVFVNASAGNGKVVNVTGLALGGTAAGNYVLSSTSAATTANITQKSVIPSITADNKEYDGSTAAVIATRSLTGVVGLDDVTLTGGTATFASAAVSNGIAVNATGLALGGTAAGNYVLSSTSAATTADISQKTLTPVVTVDDKPYDGDTTAVIATRSLTGIVGAEDVTLTGGTAAFPNANAENGKVVNVTGLALGGTAAGNYVLSSTSAAATADITQKSVIPSITADNKEYDGTTAAVIATRSLTGIVGVDDVTLTGGTATFVSATVGTGITVNATGLTLGGAAAANYALSSASAATTADISQKSVTPSITADNKEYDGSTAAVIATRSLTGVVGLDDVTLTGGTATFASAAVSNGIAVNATGLALGGTAAGNYVLSSTSAATTADISQKTLTPVVTVDDKPYDGDTTAVIATRSLTGIVGAEDVTLTGGTAAFPNANAENDKIVNVTGLALGGTAAGNYVLSSTSAAATADITQKSVIPSITADNKEYDGTTAAVIATRSLTGVVGLDDVTLTGGTAVFASPAVSNGIAVNATGLVLGGTAVGNYVLSSPSAATTADISQRMVTPSVTASNKVYDATTQAAIDTRSLTGVVGSEDVILTGGTATFVSANAESGKVVNVTGLTLGGTLAGNYMLSSTSAATTADITAKPLNVIGLTAADKPYDGLTTVVLGGAAALPAAQAPGTPVEGVPYTGDDVSLAGAATGAFATASAEVAKPVVISGLTLAGVEAGNYTLNGAATTANITPLALTIAGLVANDRDYDATTAASFNIGGAVLTGVLAGDVADVTVTGASGTFENANIGVAKPVTVSAVTLGGAAAGNYIVTPPVGLTANIAAVNLTVNGLAALDKVFDGGTSATFNTGSATLSGVVPADVGDVSIASVTGTFANAAIGSGKAVTVSAVTLSGSAAGNYTVTLPGGLAASILEPTSAPIIVAQPASQTVNEGATVSLTVIASGIPAPDIQWLKDDIIVPGGLSGTLTLSAVEADDAGSYVAIATNSIGTATSAAAVLTVNTGPVITTQPESQVAVEGDNVTFTVVATGTAPLSYQWRSGGLAIDGATSAALPLANVQTIDAGDYDVVVSNSVGSVTSATAVLAVNLPHYAGTYFGTFSGDGTWALHVREDNTATLIAYLPEQESALVLDLIINPDGTFSVEGSPIVTAASFANLAQPAESGATTPPRAAAGATFVLFGSIQNGQVTGELGGLGTTLVGSADTESGPAAALAGFYTAPALGTDTATTYSIIGPSGQMLTVTTGDDLVDGAFGTLGADGTVLKPTAGGAQFSITVDSTRQSIAAAYTRPGAPAPLTFAGVPDTVPATANLINLSVRSPAGVGDDTLIAGFVVTGTSTKSVMVRGIGPTLSIFGVNNPQTDPFIRLYSGNTFVATNDDWGVPVDNVAPITAATTAAGGFALPDGSRDAVLMADVSSGQHSVHLSTKDGAAGVALIELYDIANGGPARLANVSARSLVGSGDNVLIIGFVIDGNFPRKVLIRAIGPGLTQFDVTGVLADPQLNIYSGSTTLLHQNQVWGGTGALTTAFTEAGAFALQADSRDAVLLVTLQPGQYSVVVSGVGNTTGVALVEVYEMP